MLDKPNFVCIYFHTFTHNAIEVSKQLNNKFSIPTLFLVDSDSFKKAIEISELNTIGCLNIPTSQDQLDDIISKYTLRIHI